MITAFDKNIGINFRQPIVIDFETYYDNEYSLKKITTERYIRDDKFECIGLSIKIGNMPTNFYPYEKGLAFLKIILEQTYPNSPVVSHNNMFDMGILGLRYDMHPCFMVDTATLAKLCGLDRVAGGGSLNALSRKGLERGFVSTVKGNEVHNMVGIHANQMSEAQWAAYGEYCKLDSDICYELYMYMIDKVPLDELIMADITTKMWTKPMIDVDVPLLEDYAKRLEQEREDILYDLAVSNGYASSTELLTVLRSKPKFVGLLYNLGVDVPTKWSEKQNKYVAATAKTDTEFLALLEHPDPRVSALVEAKLGSASSMEQTRTQSFLSIASRGRMPVPLRYSAAHTGRYGGCLIGSTKVIVKRNGSNLEIPINHVLKSDLVWDGVEFVSHEGVEQRGEREVITHSGITGTPCHPCWDGSEWKPLQWFKDNNREIHYCYLPKERFITPNIAT